MCAGIYYHDLNCHTIKSKYEICLNFIHISRELVYNVPVYHLRLNFWSFFPRTYANNFMTGSVSRVYRKKSFIFFLGKCECKGILTGSNAGIMALDFDLEVRFQPEVGIILLIGHITKY